MKDVRIIQPYNAELAYTVYSVGKKTFRPAWSDDDKKYICFTYPAESVFCLFYEWKSRPRNLRRAYIVTGGKKRTCGSISLPGASCALGYLYVARGHAVDNLKRGMKYLAELSGKCFFFPEIFWYRFAALVEYDDSRRRKRTLSKENVLEFYMKWLREAS